MSDPNLARDTVGEVALILTTLPDAEAAEVLVRRLLDERVVACGNIIPGVVSIYRWEGSVTREGEVMVLLKSTTGSVERVFSRITEIHPYSTPELLSLPIAVAGEAYRRWVVACLKG